MDDKVPSQITPPASTPSQPAQAEPATAATDNISTELAHVTQEMYKRNLEMAEKNKTLSLLRKIDEIILGAVTDTKEIAQQVVNSVVEEADVKAAAVLLYNKKTADLSLLALSQTEAIINAEKQFGRKYLEQPVSLTQSQNVMVQAVMEQKMHMTDNLYDVLQPSFSLQESVEIQKNLGITHVLIYPLIVRQEMIGVMVIAIEKSDEVKSAYQRDLLDRLPGVIGIALDNALLYQNIQTANDRLKELDHMKDEFVSLASHELRTPMTAIKSYLWMLLERQMIQDPKGKEYLEHTYEATDRLINLVNDMLNVSRIESGRMVINLAPVDIQKLIAEVIAEVNPAAEKVGVTIENPPPPQTLPQVQVDANKIKEVMINLIGNSIKFTPEGGKIIISETAENGMVSVKVQDTGKGITLEDRPKLFQKFGMIEGNYNAKPITQGTGLGLYICKSIVERHGGKIDVYSEGKDKGTTFTFTLKPVA